MPLETLKKDVFRPFISKFIHEECQASNNKWVSRERIIGLLLKDSEAGKMLEEDYTIAVIKKGKHYQCHTDTIEHWTGNIIDFFSRAYTRYHEGKGGKKFRPYYDDFERRSIGDKENAEYRVRITGSKSIIPTLDSDKLLKRPLIKNSFEKMKDLSNIFLEVGRLGEEMIFAFLEKRKQSGVIEEFKWISDKYATAPYDFELKVSGITRRIDVKSTTASFLTPFYLSNAEVMTLLDCDHPYDIYRVYNLDMKEKTASLMVIRDLGTYGHHFSFLAKSPQGIQIESIKISPKILSFDSEKFELTLDTF
jgi:hypothetical protein